jgi:hypothetical protein
VTRLLEACEQDMGADVEIEFAMTFPTATDPSRPRFGFLQVRPMMVSDEQIEIAEEELTGPEVVLTSPRVMGNGVINDIRDVVYVKPEPFEAKFTVRIAAELEKINLELLEAGRPYLLIGFGRWGSSDSWLGIPVNWGQICGAKVIVEAALPQMNIEPSQGAHFFHNITSFKVSYMTVPDRAQPGIDWAWLDAQPAEHEAEYTRHVRLDEALCVKVDGRTGRGVVSRASDDHS